MSAPNFYVQSDFPLYCIDDAGMEWWEAQDLYNAIEEELDELNSNLTFYRLTIRGGYYAGAQFYVELTSDADNAGFPDSGTDYKYVDNESCRYWLDMCRSEAIRKYEAEYRKVCRLLKKTAEAWGFEEYYCTGIFSNGEAKYTKATPRSRMKSAALGLATA